MTINQTQFICEWCAKAFEADVTYAPGIHFDPNEPKCETCSEGWCAACWMYTARMPGGFVFCACG